MADEKPVTVAEIVALVSAERKRLMDKVEHHRKLLAEAKRDLKVLADSVRCSSTGIQSKGRPIMTTEFQVAARQACILGLLPNNKEQAISPAEIYPFIFETERTLTIDTLRTTIWRMKNHYSPFADGTVVMAEDGKYWKEIPNGQAG